MSANEKGFFMLKRFACLFPLTLILALGLMLPAGCGVKSRQATSEDLLQKMAGRWEVDVDASMKVDSGVREEILDNGEEKFVTDYGQFGVGLNMQTREFALYKSRKALLDKWPFVVAPETPEDTAAREKGIRQVRLGFTDDGGAFSYELRDEPDGKLSVFAEDGLVGVFYRLKD